ncbi:urea amidolyase [Halarcobacter mediterraneus]|uniref:Urea amidolyase n=1 Tax=Halarcobacter mediterraneus TaxID=2023153 RepID=A0A4Q1B2P2_9BACT|nr:biotin-dependent carboxyltransferase family protein [Halarcobacter mediterraneus]RXK12209.1 urea amidolyase [Halarcobacter mediterraneus]
MSGLEIIKAGIYSTIQDKGRFSYMHLGVTNSGFMDEYAAFACNKLLKNEIHTNLLEILFPNVIFKVKAETTIAITGAKCEFFINNIPLDTWQAYKVKASDEIKIGKIQEGQRVYLAVKDGFDIEKEFGSNSTSMKEKFGGLNGDKLKNGDILPYKESTTFIKRKWKKSFLPKYEKEIVLRVILSYQYEDFDKEALDKFFSSIYTITPDFNSMACKLDGEKISCNISTLVSEAIAFGSIQIPKDGKPIILLKERQTIGGYPKIGTVLNIDCFKLAQMKPGYKVRFKKIGIEEAQQKAKEFLLTF